MKRVATSFVPAEAGNKKGSHVAPGALVDGFVDVDVLGLLLAVKRPVGRKTNTLWCSTRGSIDLPALIGEGDVDLLPDLGVLNAVVGLQVVHVKTADVTEDLLGALIAPMLI